MSSDADVFEALRFISAFFIDFSFAACRLSCADDANRLSSIYVRNCQHMASIREPEQHKPFLAMRVSRIGQNTAQRITEGGRGLLE